MSSQLPVSPPQPTLVSIWTCLTTERRRKAIYLMAQLAFKLAVAQPNSSLKEVQGVVRDEHSQDRT